MQINYRAKSSRQDQSTWRAAGLAGMWLDKEDKEETKWIEEQKRKQREREKAEAEKRKQKAPPAGQQAGH